MKIQDMQANVAFDRITKFVGEVDLEVWATITSQAGLAQPALPASFLSRKETRDNRYPRSCRGRQWRMGFCCLLEGDYGR